MKVTADAQRPADTMIGRCFYCHRMVGVAHHEKDCPCIKKKVLIRMTVEYEVSVPAYWKRDKVEQHRNSGTWCADNALHELANLSSRCLCGKAQFKYIKAVGKPFLGEK